MIQSIKSDLIMAFMVIVSVVVIVFAIIKITTASYEKDVQMAKLGYQEQLIGNRIIWVKIEEINE